jgi:hypothetical protein
VGGILTLYGEISGAAAQRGHSLAKLEPILSVAGVTLPA